jgi:hypothetical protein
MELTKVPILIQGTPIILKEIARLLSKLHFVPMLHKNNMTLIGDLVNWTKIVNVILLNHNVKAMSTAQYLFWLTEQLGLQNVPYAYWA